MHQKETRRYLLEPPYHSFLPETIVGHARLTSSCPYMLSQVHLQVSFMLMMRSSGCLYVTLKMASSGVCADRLPSRTQCESSDYNFFPSAPGIDTSNPKLQHVVVSHAHF